MCTHILYTINKVYNTWYIQYVCMCTDWSNNKTITTTRVDLLAPQRPHWGYSKYFQPVTYIRSWHTYVHIHTYRCVSLLYTALVKWRVWIVAESIQTEYHTQMYWSVLNYELRFYNLKVEVAAVNRTTERTAMFPYNFNIIHCNSFSVLDYWFKVCYNLEYTMCK